ncbi:MAG: DNA ligase D, partial [Candidatus Eremiobacterota bacterium]
PDWCFEPKLDGVRLLVRLESSEARLFSRQGREITRQYPSLAATLASLPLEQGWLDGEVVAHGSDGRPDFERLQHRINLERESDIQRAEREIPVICYAFDLLHLDGFDLTRVPLEHRQRLLDTVLVPAPAIAPVARFSDGLASFDAVLELGLEGLMAKRLQSGYEEGRRSPDWLKVKSFSSDEFLVVGYRLGEGSRAPTFGSLVLASPGPQGQLVHVGDVGSGFDDAALVRLGGQLQEWRIPNCPLPADPGGSPTVWVEPRMVVEVRYADRTSQGKLRAPVFVRVRPDLTGEPRRGEPASAQRDASESPSPDGFAPSRGGGFALQRLLAMGAQGTLDVDGYGVALTNLDKSLFPCATKRDLIAYLIRVGPFLLPHLRDRPLTLTRYPDGIGGSFFFQKHWNSELPPFVETAPSREGEPWLLCHNLATLVWLGQLANLELHAWLSRAVPLAGADDPLDCPDFLLFDLDPYIYSGEEAVGAEPELNRAAFRKVADLAVDLRSLLAGLGMRSFVKTSGKTGLHLFVPIRRGYPFETVRAAARTVAQYVLQQRPDDVTLEWPTGRRTGKIFLDVNQNSYGKSLAWAYSPRPVASGAVSTPLTWEELGSAYPDQFTLATVPARLEQMGDPWRDILVDPPPLAGAGSQD